MAGSFTVSAEYCRLSSWFRAAARKCKTELDQLLSFARLGFAALPSRNPYREQFLRRAHFERMAQLEPEFASLSSE
jgi:hypothetical protein